MMKKTLVALAALATTGAFAQSSVTISGQLDVGLYTSTAANSGYKSTGINGGQWGASRLAIRGVEDMGGGQKANFWLEMQPGMNNGTTSAFTSASNSATSILFNRGAWLGLSGANWGEIRLGRQGTASIGLVCTIDQLGCYSGFSGGGILFSGNGAGGGNISNSKGAVGEWISANPTRGGAGQAISTQTVPNGGPASNVAASADVTRVVNGFTYLTPNFSGFSAKAQYAFSNANNSVSGWSSSQGASVGLEAEYGQGPVFVGLAYQTAGSDPTINATGKLLTLGGTYDFNVAKVGLAYQRETANGAAAMWTGATGLALTVSAPLGAFTPYLKIGQRKVTSGGLVAYTGTASQVFNLGTTYALSKRTKLYLDYAKDSKAGTYDAAVAGGNGTNPSILQMGIQHSF